MKKTIIIVIAVVLCIAAVVTLPFNYFINDTLLGGMVMTLRGELSAADIETVDIQSATGKLYGNGNGIQFFGAALVHGDVSDIEAAVETLSEKFDVADYCEQTDAQIELKYAEHAHLSYDAENFTDGEAAYYTVYFFHMQDFCNSFDVRGH